MAYLLYVNKDEKSVYTQKYRKKGLYTQKSHCIRAYTHLINVYILFLMVVKFGENERMYIYGK